MTSGGTAEPQEVCPIDGISPTGRARRGVLGGVWLLLGIGGGVWCSLHGIERTARWPLFVVFLFAGVGIFQATERVCVALAFRGQRESASGGFVELSQTELTDHRRRAARIWGRSFGLAFVLTALALIM